MATIDDYLAKLNQEQKAALERVRRIIQETIPEAKETISYDMPTFRLKGKRLIEFAAFKDHMSIFGNVESVEEKLGDFKLSRNKGTVQFTEDNQIPEPLLKEILLKRASEISRAQR